MTWNNTQPSATQLISAGQATILNNFQFLGSIAGNVQNPGFYKFPNGLIVQWGTEFAITAGNHDKTFPIAYTTCFNVQLTVVNDSSGTKWISLNQNAGSGGFPWSPTKFFYRVSAAGQDLSWFAIGV